LNSPALLDANVLIALFDQDHPHHEAAHDWFADNRGRGWATCPITESALLRVLGNPRYLPAPERVSSLVGRLTALCAGSDHTFWPASLSLRDVSVFDLSAAAHRQLTDIYLAGLAHANGGVLATFDRTIPARAVVGATPDLLEVIGA
jgi:uncharacterized protein